MADLWRRGASDPDHKFDVPSAADQAAATEQLKRWFPPQRMKDAAVVVQRALAQEMSSKLLDTGITPSQLYLLLSEERDSAKAAGAVPLVIEACDVMYERFEVKYSEWWVTRLDALTTAVATSQRLIGHGGVAAEQARRDLLIGVTDLIRDSEWSAQASAWGDTDKDLDLAAAAARAAGSKELGEIARQRKASLKTRAAADRDNILALNAIRRNPADAPANLRWGLYLGAERKNWISALPYLARCGDAVFESIAKQDLAKPLTSEEQAGLADEWWKAADHGEPVHHDGLRQRALYWYQQALPGLTGESQARAQQRITQYSNLNRGAGPQYTMQPEILQVTYGIGQHTIDLTDAVENTLQHDQFAPISADVSLGIGAEPHVLLVRYRLGNRTNDVAIPPGQAVFIPPYPRLGLRELSEGAEFSIVAARLGAGITWRDITDEVRTLVLDPKQSYKLKFESPTTTPASKSRQHLAIWYVYHGRRYGRLIDEAGGAILVKLRD